MLVDCTDCSWWQMKWPVSCNQTDLLSCTFISHLPSDAFDNTKFKQQTYFEAFFTPKRIFFAFMRSHRKEVSKVKQFRWEPHFQPYSSFIGFLMNGLRPSEEGQQNQGKEKIFCLWMRKRDQNVKRRNRYGQWATNERIVS